MSTYYRFDMYNIYIYIYITQCVFTYIYLYNNLYIYIVYNVESLGVLREFVTITKNSEVHGVLLLQNHLGKNVSAMPKHS